MGRAFVDRVISLLRRENGQRAAELRGVLRRNGCHIRHGVQRWVWLAFPCPVARYLKSKMAARCDQTWILFFSALGAAYGTAKSGTGIAAMSVMRPELIMKSIIPVVMAGIIAIYGLVVAVLIGNGSEFYFETPTWRPCQDAFSIRRVSLDANLFDLNANKSLFWYIHAHSCYREHFSTSSRCYSNEFVMWLLVHWFADNFFFLFSGYRKIHFVQVSHVYCAGLQKESTLLVSKITPMQSLSV